MLRHLLPLFLFLSITVLQLSGSHHEEDDRPMEESEVSPAFKLAILADHGKWDLHLSLSGEFRQVSSDFFELESLLYYRILKHVKAGVFYTLERGERHDDDWIQEGDHWFWQDSSRRLENTLGADITPRVLLPFLPGSNWLLYGKGRYSINLNNRQQKILFRPELSYFHMKNRRLRWSSAAAYALYFPLNFGETLLYEHGPYLSFNWHIEPRFMAGIRGEYRIRNWSSSQDFKEAGGSYTVSEKRLSLGASLVWKIDIRDKKR